jgi:hypothetical protein
MRHHSSRTTSLLSLKLKYIEVSSHLFPSSTLHASGDRHEPRAIKVQFKRQDAGPMQHKGEVQGNQKELKNE